VTAEGRYSRNEGLFGDEGLAKIAGTSKRASPGLTSSSGAWTATSTGWSSPKSAPGTARFASTWPVTLEAARASGIAEGSSCALAAGAWCACNCLTSNRRRLTRWSSANARLTRESTAWRASRAGPVRRVGQRRRGVSRRDGVHGLRHRPARSRGPAYIPCRSGNRHKVPRPARGRLLLLRRTVARTLALNGRAAEPSWSSHLPHGQTRLSGARRPHSLTVTMCTLNF
jgi:hypothetical protein